MHRRDSANTDAGRSNFAAKSYADQRAIVLQRRAAPQQDGYHARNARKDARVRRIHEISVTPDPTSTGSGGLGGNIQSLRAGEVEAAKNEGVKLGRCAKDPRCLRRDISASGYHLGRCRFVEGAGDKWEQDATANAVGEERLIERQEKNEKIRLLNLKIQQLEATNTNLNNALKKRVADSKKVGVKAEHSVDIDDDIDVPASLPPGGYMAKADSAPFDAYAFADVGSDGSESSEEVNKGQSATSKSRSSFAVQTDETMVQVFQKPSKEEMLTCNHCLSGVPTSYFFCGMCGQNVADDNLDDIISVPEDKSDGDGTHSGSEHEKSPRSDDAADKQGTRRITKFIEHHPQFMALQAEIATMRQGNLYEMGMADRLKEEMQTIRKNEAEQYQGRMATMSEELQTYKRVQSFHDYQNPAAMELEIDKLIQSEEEQSKQSEHRIASMEEDIEKLKKRNVDQSKQEEIRVATIEMEVASLRQGNESDQRIATMHEEVANVRLEQFEQAKQNRQRISGMEEEVSQSRTNKLEQFEQNSQHIAAIREQVHEVLRQKRERAGMEEELAKMRDSELKQHEATLEAFASYGEEVDELRKEANTQKTEEFYEAAEQKRKQGAVAAKHARAEITMLMARKKESQMRTESMTLTNKRRTLMGTDAASLSSKQREELDQLAHEHSNAEATMNSAQQEEVHAQTEIRLLLKERAEFQSNALRSEVVAAQQHAQDGLRALRKQREELQVRVRQIDVTTEEHLGQYREQVGSFRKEADSQTAQHNAESAAVYQQLIELTGKHVKTENDHHLVCQSIQSNLVNQFDEIAIQLLRCESESAQWKVEDQQSPGPHTTERGLRMAGHMKEELARLQAFDIISLKQELSDSEAALSSSSADFNKGKATLRGRIFRKRTEMRKSIGGDSGDGAKLSSDDSNQIRTDLLGLEKAEAALEIEVDEPPPTVRSLGMESSNTATPFIENLSKSVKKQQSKKAHATDVVARLQRAKDKAEEHANALQESEKDAKQKAQKEQDAKQQIAGIRTKSAAELHTSKNKLSDIQRTIANYEVEKSKAETQAENEEDIHYKEMYEAKASKIDQAMKMTESMAQEIREEIQTKELSTERACNQLAQDSEWASYQAAKEVEIQSRKAQASESTCELDDVDVKLQELQSRKDRLRLVLYQVEHIKREQYEGTLVRQLNAKEQSSLAKETHIRQELQNTMKECIELVEKGAEIQLKIRRHLEQTRETVGLQLAEVDNLRRLEAFQMKESGVPLSSFQQKILEREDPLRQEMSRVKKKIIEATSQLWDRQRSVVDEQNELNEQELSTAQLHSALLRRSLESKLLQVPQNSDDELRRSNDVAALQQKIGELDRFLEEDQRRQKILLQTVSRLQCIKRGQFRSRYRAEQAFLQLYERVKAKRKAEASIQEAESVKEAAKDTRLISIPMVPLPLTVDLVAKQLTEVVEARGLNEQSREEPKSNTATQVLEAVQQAHELSSFQSEEYLAEVRKLRDEIDEVKSDSVPAIELQEFDAIFRSELEGFTEAKLELEVASESFFPIIDEYRDELEKGRVQFEQTQHRVEIMGQRAQNLRIEEVSLQSALSERDAEIHGHKMEHEHMQKQHSERLSEHSDLQQEMYLLEQTKEELLNQESSAYALVDRYKSFMQNNNHEFREMQEEADNWKQKAMKARRSMLAVRLLLGQQRATSVMRYEQLEMLVDMMEKTGEETDAAQALEEYKKSEYHMHTQSLKRQIFYSVCDDTENFNTLDRAIAKWDPPRCCSITGMGNSDGIYVQGKCTRGRPMFLRLGTGLKRELIWTGKHWAVCCGDAQMPVAINRQNVDYPDQCKLTWVQPNRNGQFTERCIFAKVSKLTFNHAQARIRDQCKSVMLRHELTEKSHETMETEFQKAEACISEVANAHNSEHEQYLEDLESSYSKFEASEHTLQAAQQRLEITERLASDAVRKASAAKSEAESTLGPLKGMKIAGTGSCDGMYFPNGKSHGRPSYLRRDSMTPKHLNWNGHNWVVSDSCSKQVDMACRQSAETPDLCIQPWMRKGQNGRYSEPVVKAEVTPMRLKEMLEKMEAIIGAAEKEHTKLEDRCESHEERCKQAEEQAESAGAEALSAEGIPLSPGRRESETPAERLKAALDKLSSVEESLKEARVGLKTAEDKEAAAELKAGLAKGTNVRGLTQAIRVSGIRGAEGVYVRRGALNGRPYYKRFGDGVETEVKWSGFAWQISSMLDGHMHVLAFNKHGPATPELCEHSWQRKVAGAVVEAFTSAQVQAVKLSEVEALAEKQTEEAEAALTVSEVNLEHCEERFAVAESRCEASVQAAAFSTEPVEDDIMKRIIQLENKVISARERERGMKAAHEDLKRALQTTRSEADSAERHLTTRRTGEEKPQSIRLSNTGDKDGLYVQVRGTQSDYKSFERIGSAMEPQEIVWNGFHWFVRSVGGTDNILMDEDSQRTLTTLTGQLVKRSDDTGLFTDYQGIAHVEAVDVENVCDQLVAHYEHLTKGSDAIEAQVAKLKRQQLDAQERINSVQAELANDEVLAKQSYEHMLDKLRLLDSKLRSAMQRKTQSQHSLEKLQESAIVADRAANELERGRLIRGKKISYKLSGVEITGSGKTDGLYFSTPIEASVSHADRLNYFNASAPYELVWTGHCWAIRAKSTSEALVINISNVHSPAGATTEWLSKGDHGHFDHVLSDCRVIAVDYQQAMVRLHDQLDRVNEEQIKFEAEKATAEKKMKSIADKVDQMKGNVTSRQEDQQLLKRVLQTQESTQSLESTVKRWLYMLSDKSKELDSLLQSIDPHGAARQGVNLDIAAGALRTTGSLGQQQQTEDQKREHAARVIQDFYRFHYLKGMFKRKSLLPRSSAVFHANIARQASQLGEDALNQLEEASDSQTEEDKKEADSF